MKNLYILLSLLISLGLSGQNNIDRLFRFPATNGEMVVFTYAGDLYSVPISGGKARQLTSDKGYEMFAHFSPDGKTIAFTAQYDGNTEVYTIPTNGGAPKRLTITATLHRDDVSDRMGPNNIVMGWTPDGKYVIYRSRKQSHNDFVGQLFKVPATGGPSEELPLPTGGFCSYNADGSKLSLNRVFREFRTWKYYEGGMADDIWIYDFKTKETVNCTKNKAQDIFPMWNKNRVYFISDRDRIMNLFYYDVDSRQTVKVTNHNTYDIKFPTIHNDNIAYENGGYIYIYNITKQEETKVNVVVESEARWGREALVDASKSIAGVDLSPKGNRIIASARGEIFNIPVKNGITYNVTKSSGAHDRDPEFSPDGKKFAFISDLSGEFEIYLQDADMKAKPVQLTKNSKSYIFNLMWSPDSKKILYYDKEMTLKIIDTETKNTTLITKSKTWEISDFTWSPDSRFVAFSDNDGDGLNKIFIYTLETKKITPVTEGWYSSSSPEFSEDGKYLFFTSNRTFNPIYSATEWNVAYRNMDKIYFITLQKDLKSPFINSDEFDTTDPKETKESKDSKGSKDEKTSVETKNITIDFEGITDRIVDIPTPAGSYFNLISVGDKIYYSYFYFGQPGSELKFYDLKAKKETSIGKNMTMGLSAEKKKAIIFSNQKMYVVDLPSNKIELSESVNTDDMKIYVDPHAEWAQIYNEAWRQMRDFFYDPNMHGVDWEKMRDKYSVMLPYVNHRNDLTYLIGELIGELNVGHAYVGGGDKPEVEKVYTGLLGAKISQDKSGFYKIEKILKGENYRDNLRSPLTEVGVDVKEGDFIIAIDGVKTSELYDINLALRGKANKLVKLTVNSTASETGCREVVVKTIEDEAGLYYYNWVQENIEKVEKATNGQVGYIHVPDMGPDGLNEFMKHFYPLLTKKALIIDDRGNGGGNVSPMLLERLGREMTRANTARNQTIPGTTPRQMMNGPMVLLINQYSASDGDLFPYGFKKHQLGKVIGVRSWGGVVGIRGSLPFIDGGNLTRPEFASYSSDGKEWIIEGYGVDPDIVVENDPAREYQGIDDQLNKAIEVILLELKDTKPTPEPPKFPVKSK